VMLVHRYGYAAREVLALAEERDELRERIVPGLPDILAEVVVAAEDEQAQSLGDVLLRRTRLGLLAARAVTGEDDGVPGRVSRILGDELGWDDARRAAELAAWREEAREEGIAREGAAAA